MIRLRLDILPRLCVIALLLSMLPIGSAAQVQNNSFTSTEYGFTLDWTSDWQVVADSATEYGVMLQRGPEIAIVVDGFPGDAAVGSLLAPHDGETVVMDDLNGTPPRAVYANTDGVHIYVEAYSIAGADVTILITLHATPDELADAVEFAYEELSLDGEALITGDPLETNGIPEETSATTIEAQSQEPGSFTGPVYGYSISYDPAVWNLGTEIHEGNVDGIQLIRDGTAFTIWAWDNYGSDPLVCLESEIAYYAQEVDAISDWQPALNANGEPLRYESDNLAWGVFNMTYTYPDGTTGSLVDYLSCEPIPGQDTVLIAHVSSHPQIYDAEFELALDVLDTLEFSDAPDTETTAATVEPEPEDTTIEIDTGVSGSDFTSPNYGFTVSIPLQWQILEESAEGTDELLVVSNGTSTVTLWATEAFVGDLEGCVDFAADASGLTLRIDQDAAGGEFRGVYRNEAFANFVYEEGGTQMMYFINCQAIPGTNGHLILIHDVEYDLFTAERRFRNEIENSIVMP